jgi:hypothetical protein
MLKKGKSTQDKKGQYLQKDSSFNIRNLVMRTPTSSSPDRSPDIYSEEKQTKSIKQDIAPKPSLADLLKIGNEKLEDLIQELSSFDVSTIQRRSDPRMKALTGRINDTIAEIFGHNTEEYDDYVIYSLDTLPITIGGSWYPLPEVREGYQKGIRSAVTKLISLLNAQDKRIEALTAEKPFCPAPQEQTANPIIAAKEKVSLVNLRGKIRSRETVLFSHRQPANGNGPAPHSLIPEPNLPEGTTRGADQGKSYDPPGTKEKGISDVNGDQRLIKEIPRDHKNIVLLENLEEKLRKLEEEMPVFEEPEQEIILSQNQESKTASVQQEQGNKLPGKPDLEGVPLATLMAKLNEIVSNEPEYVEAYTKMVPGNEEKVLPLYEDEDLIHAVIDGETSHASFMEMAGLESSGLEIEDEVFVIDGDNVLSSESNFIEALEGDSRSQKAVESVQKNEHVDNITDGKKRISLEALEQKLKEFEEREVAGKVLPTDSEITESEEVLLIEGTDELPEGMMNELAHETGPAEVCEAEFGNEEVLVIDSYEGLPEDVSDELPPEVALCDNQEEKSYEFEARPEAPNSLDVFPDQIDTNRASIIDLFCQATQFDVVLQDRNEHTRKAVLLEELGERLRDFDSLQSDQEYLNPMNFYNVEETEFHSEEREADEHTAEKHFVDLTDSNHKQSKDQPMVVFGHDYLTSTPVHESIIEPALYVTLEHEITSPSFMEMVHTQGGSDLLYDITETVLAGSDQESQVSDNIVEDETLELSETAVYGESSKLEPEKGFFAAGWDDLLYQEAATELIENTLFFEPTEEIPDKDLIEEKTYETLPEQILLKDVRFLSDHDYETLIASPVDVFGFEPTLIESDDEKSLEHEIVELAQFESGALPDVENEDQGELDAFGEVIPEEAVFIVSGEELTKEATRELGQENEITLMELPEQITDALERNIADEGMKTISERVELPHDIAETLLDEVVLADANVPQEPLSLQPDINQVDTEAISKNFDFEADFSQLVRDLATEPVLLENNNEIPESHEIVELVSAERREFGLLEIDDVFAAVDQDTMTNDAIFELTGKCGPLDLLENNSEDDTLSLEAFEKCLQESEVDTIAESRVEESSRDSILLEALEEMLSNLETSTPGQSYVQSDEGTAQSSPPPKDEKVLLIESHKEPPKKAVLIKTGDERGNPFAVTDIGKERTHSKVLRADDLYAQIGELRCRIDDLKSFDVNTIEQRFDPRVRALGDTVNGTLADIFGRNTSAYWQHALPSLDSLPVVVGGPKLSQEELRDAYRRRINDAISKVNITIDILQAKLSKCENKGVMRVQSDEGTAQSSPPPKDEKVLLIESHKEPPKKAVLIKTGDERGNPFAVTDIGKERTHSKVLRADDLYAQIGELRCRIDDLKSFDVNTIEQRFDPRVRALGDTVNGTLADIFGRNTSAYWQHALPSLDSLPVVVGGPKLSQEELRDAYRRRINDAISKVNITIDILQAKLSKCEDKGAGGQVLFFAPKAPEYPDIQSIR